MTQGNPDPLIDESGGQKKIPVSVPRQPTKEDQEQFDRFLEKSERQMKRLERAGRTGNPLGLKGKEAKVLFDWITFQTNLATRQAETIKEQEAEIEALKKKGRRIWTP